MKRGPVNRSHQKKALPANFDLEIDSFSHDGRGIGRHHGRVVMVKGALPGERVEVRLEQANSKLWQGRIQKLHRQSEQRLAPQCAHYHTCGGCQLQHAPHGIQIELKQKAVEDHFSRNGLPAFHWSETLLSEDYHYRHRARFHINSKGQIGFHGAKGNQVIAVDQCAVLSKPLAKAFDHVKTDAPLIGLSQLEVVVDDQGTIGLIAVKGKGSSIAEINRWATQQGWVTNERISYAAGPITVFAKPGEFTQVNRAVNEAMLAQAAQWLGIGASSRVLDLFCGNGNLGLSLSERQDLPILGIESVESAIQNATDASTGRQATFEVENLFLRPLSEISSIGAFEPNTVIIDPPRAGAELVCQSLKKVKNVNKLLYISCDPATLARDLKFIHQDNWHLSKVSLVDMFPQTRHIETMVLLEK